ncbi:lantibiotic dehydratase [Asanoa sp. NPDC049518]|uniref:lantibiotic dehydratase n=1 Tax=unclassified Asanoa TaxID=2685164 RepID=UPI00341CA178
METEHHVALGDTGWLLWRDAALRGTGFPARRFLDICDDLLAAAADEVDEHDAASREKYAVAFAEAADRLSAAVRRTAAESRFREAVTWQNPTLVETCLDKVATRFKRDVRGRNYELTIASYLQRYCLKNDSIGFFGPVGWARFDPDEPGLAMEPGPELLASRRTSFEDWAVDAVAEVVAARAEVWPWLRPRMVSYASLVGWTLHLPFARPVTLPAAEARLLRRCDGTRTVRDLVGDPADPRAVAALVRLRERGAVQVDLGGPPSLAPERDLAARIDLIGDPAVRARAAAPLAELVAARDDVAAAAGRPERLSPAFHALAEVFERITGRAATRRAGATYAGRTLICEDTVRAVDVRIGRAVVDRLAASLGPVLDSASWLVDTLGARYEARAREVLDRQAGADGFPLPRLVAALLPELLEPGRVTADAAIANEVAADFQDRWHRVLGLTPELLERTRRHHVPAEAVAGAVAAEFPTGEPRWVGPRWHSPDLMLSATDLAALARGDVDVVLGELHCGDNTLEGQVFAAQHPDLARVRAAAQASGLSGRVILVPSRGTERTSSRVSRTTEALLPSYTYIAFGPEAFAPPPGATLLSALDLTVHRRGDTLVVRHRGGAEHPFLEVIREPLIALFLNGFRPVGGVRHRPRVTIDRLVLAREAWTFAASELDWVFVKDEARRYLGARRWRSAHGLPERGVFRVPVERKPVVVDFRSLPLVNLLAKSVRRSAEAGQGTVTITEMLPDIDQLWLADAEGARYTAELRVIAVRDPGAS